MSNPDASAVLAILDTLLSQVEQPSNEGDPLLLCHQNICAAEIGEICVALSNSGYVEGEKSLTADEYVKVKLNSGFTVMNMSIVRGHNYGETTRHEVMTVLIKKKNN